MVRALAHPIAALIATVALAAPAAAGEPLRLAGDDGSNVRVDLTITEGGGAHRLSTLLLEGQRTRINSGWRIPTRTGEGGESAIQYQNVGLGFTARVRRVAADRFRLDGEIDLSSVGGDAVPPSGSGTPVVTTLRHTFDVALRDGDEATLVEMPRLDGGSVRLTVTAAAED